MFLKLALGAAVLFSATVARAAEPVYSSVKSEDCVLYDLFQTGASMACRGVGGYSLAISDADLRIYLTLLHPNWDEAAKIDLMKLTGGGFSSLPGDLVEWRGPKSAPTALIMRLGFNEGDGKPGDQALAVIRLDNANPAKTCLIGGAPRGEAMNEEARKLADAAADRPCL